MAQMTLEELVRQLQLVYGTELRCVAVYGSAARGEHVARRSDTNVLVVVDRITMEHLRQEGAVSRSWREAGNPPPLTLTMTEWRGSADIFPIEYMDILAYHRVVHGTLPVEGIVVRPADLRLQLEHEAMGKLLRLRHAVLSASGDSRALLELLDSSVSSILALLRATLRLVGEEPPADSLAMLDRFAARTAIPAAAFQRVVERARKAPGSGPGGGVKASDGAAVRALMEEYLSGVGALVEFLDRYEQR